MEHIILFCYIFSILIGVIAITIEWLALSRKNTKNERNIMYFVSLLLIMNVYDMLIYYSDYILKNIDTIELVRIGDCLIAIIVFFWLNVQKDIVKDNLHNWIIKIASGYLKIYLITWFLLTFVFTNLSITKSVFSVIDIVLLLLLIIGSLMFLNIGTSKAVDKNVKFYMIVITTMMAINFIVYFSSETLEGWLKYEFNDNLLNFTIFFWFVINIGNIIMLYSNDFVGVYGNGLNDVAFNLERALDKLQKEKDLTTRERELAKKIYEGKSNIEIAHDLFISESTVKTHIYNIFRKLDAKSRVEVVCLIRGEKKEEKDG